MIPQGGACFWSTWGFLRTKALRAGEGGDRSVDPKINKVTKDVAPEAVFDEIEIQQDPSAQTAV